MVIIAKELLNILKKIKNMVRLERLELSLGKPHLALNQACLPIPA